MNTTIRCIHCGKDFELSDALKHEIEEKVKQSVSAEFAQKQNIELVDLKKQLEEQKKKNEEAAQNELELRRQKRELEEREKNLELETARKMDEERKKIEENVLKAEDERRKMQDKEKDMQIENLKHMLEEANRKASGVSQQVQGEVLEVDLEETLVRSFPTDTIEPVAKGVAGGDIVQTVKNSMGKTAGAILWETKRAKWSPSWLSKLRDDTRKVSATSSILVTEDLPKDLESFGFVDGVLVTSYRYALALAVIVRRGIMQTAAAKAAAAAKDESLEMVYQYLQSDSFRHRIEGYIDGIHEMKIDLDSERRSMERIWKKREMQITKSEMSIAKLYGELQGIMGASLPEIKTLTLPGGDEE